METELWSPVSNHSPAIKQDNAKCNGIEHEFCPKLEALLGPPKYIDTQGLLKLLLVHSTNLESLIICRLPNSLVLLYPLLGDMLIAKYYMPQCYFAELKPQSRWCSKNHLVKSNLRNSQYRTPLPGLEMFEPTNQVE